MGSMKIPVWVYTAKNGYAWQGLEDNPEDRPTAAALDKALAAAGKTAGAWGAVVRRPVASRRWAEWPRSRLCWLLFRFHPEAGRDQRGRSCNYTAVTCIPAGNGLPKLDFGKLFADPALAEVKSEGLGDIWIDLDGDEDFALKAPLLKPRGADAPPDPSWVDSWGTPILLKDDALRTLSRWCQDPRVDAGDLKAIVREGMAGADEPVVHATWTVYPQVAAAKAAEREWFAAQGEGGATARQALEKWRAALGAVGELNRALGGLEGLAALAGKWNASLEKAADATREAELSARQRAAAAASAEAAAEEIKRGLQRYRMATDAERGKGANRWKLDDLGRQIEDARRRHGPGARWNAAEQELDELRRRTTLLEGHMDTLRAYQRSAAEGKGSPLEQEAREALARARELARWGNGTFAQEAIFEMERLYRIGHAQSAPAPAPAPAGGGNAEYVRHGRGHRRRSGRHWWKKWRGAVAALSATALLASGLAAWMWMRTKVDGEMMAVRTNAMKAAAAGNYENALKEIHGIPVLRLRFLLLNPRRFAPPLLVENWNFLQTAGPALEQAKLGAQQAKEKLEALETSLPDYLNYIQYCTNEWARYTQARSNALAQVPDAQFRGTNGLYYSVGVGGHDYLLTQEQVTALTAKNRTAERLWTTANKALVAAKRKTTEALGQQDIETARAAAQEAQSRLTSLENLHPDYKHHTRHCAPEWQGYTQAKNAAQRCLQTPPRTWNLSAAECDAVVSRYQCAEQQWNTAKEHLEAAGGKIIAGLRKEIAAADESVKHAREQLETLEKARPDYAQHTQVCENEWSEYQRAKNVAGRMYQTCRPQGVTGLDAAIDGHKKQGVPSADELATWAETLRDVDGLLQQAKNRFEAAGRKIQAELDNQQKAKTLPKIEEEKPIQEEAAQDPFEAGGEAHEEPVEEGFTEETSGDEFIEADDGSEDESSAQAPPDNPGPLRRWWRKNILRSSPAPSSEPKSQSAAPAKSNIGKNAFVKTSPPAHSKDKMNSGREGHDKGNGGNTAEAAECVR